MKIYIPCYTGSKYEAVTLESLECNVYLHSDGDYTILLIITQRHIMEIIFIMTSKVYMIISIKIMVKQTSTRLM